MNKSILNVGFVALMLGTVSCSQQPTTTTLPETKTLTKEVLMDKIKGGWAGQTIGCTYGGPTEFKFNGTMIQDNIPIEWHDHYIKWWYENIKDYFLCNNVRCYNWNRSILWNISWFDF